MIIIKTANNKIDLLSLIYHETKDINAEKEMQIHFHRSHEIIYIVKGAAQFKIGDRAYTCKNNSMIFLNNLEKHERTVLEYPYHRYFLLINPDYFSSLIKEPLLSSLWKQRPEHFVHLLDLEEEEVPFFNDLFAKMLVEFNSQLPFWENAMGSYLYLLLCKLFRAHKTYFPLTTLNDTANTALKIQKYLDEHAAEDIFLKDIAKMFHIDMYYLSHIFKKITGYTFKEYLTLQRISKAKDLLLNSSMNITNICMESGFNNVNHFIRIFKKYENITPYQYRKRSL